MTLSSTAVETAIAQCTSRWAMARGHRLNTSIVLAAVHGLSGLFRTVFVVEPSLCRPLPTLSPSLIGHLASVDVKQHERRDRVCWCDEGHLVLTVTEIEVMFSAFRKGTRKPNRLAIKERDPQTQSTGDQGKGPANPVYW